MKVTLWVDIESENSLFIKWIPKALELPEAFNKDYLPKVIVYKGKCYTEKDRYDNPHYEYEECSAWIVGENE